MGEKRSAWILCPSKKFPGKFYYFNTQNGEKAWSWTDNTNKLHTESREDVSPTITNNNFVDKTQARFKQMPNYPYSSRPSSILHNESEEFTSSMLSNNQFVNNTQENCKPTPNNPFLWRQSRKLHSECRESSSPISNSFITDAQTSWKLMPNNPLSSGQANKFYTKFKKFGSQTTNSSCLSGKTQLNDKLVQNNNLSSGKRKRLYKETREFISPATSSKFSCRSQATFKLMQNNPFLLRQPKQLHTQPIKFDSNKRYKPLLGNPFSEEHGQAKKRTRIDTQFASPLMSLDVVDQISNNSSSTTINHYRNDNMKIVIDIKFLRNLSKSELVKEWHIVPDVEVLLENLDFLKEFIAADPTCTMMAPAAVLKKLQSLEDSRATVAEQVYQWLAKHSVCEINNQDEFPLNDTSINEQIIKFCVEAKILHVVIITKQENLRNAARNNGLHAYFLSELKITKQYLGDKNLKNNLFLQGLDNLDPFLISKSVQSVNISSSDELTYDINENSNNTTNNNLNRLKLNPPRMLNVSSYQITRSQHNERDRTIFNSQNFEKSNQKKYIDPPSNFMRNVRIDTNTKPVEDEESEENLNITLKSHSQKSYNRFEGFRHHTRFANATNVFHNVTNKNQSVVEPNSKTQINWFEGLKDASIGTNVFNKISDDRNKKQNVIKAKKRKKHNKSESIKFNTPINTNVFNNKSSARNREDKDVLPKVPEPYNQFGGITFSAPIEMSNFTDDDESVFPKICNTNEIQNGVNLSARGQTNASNKTSVSQKNPYQSNENQSAKKPNAQNDNRFEVAISNEDLDSNACMDQTSNVHEYDEMIEGQLRDFCTKHSKLQNCINDRVDEWSCCFVQIMEQFLDDVFQTTPVEKFDPPYWFQQGLKCLREYYSQNKYIGTVIDKLIGLCGYCIKNGIVRTNMRADKFLKILGAGILLIERIDKIAQFPEISEFYKEMLYHLVTTIQDPGDFPEMLCLNMEFSLRIGDEAFRIENYEGMQRKRANIQKLTGLIQLCGNGFNKANLWNSIAVQTNCTKA